MIKVPTLSRGPPPPLGHNIDSYITMNALVSLLFFEKKTYTGLLTNYFSFTPFQYKLGLIKTLIDRAYKINHITHYFET